MYTALQCALRTAMRRTAFPADRQQGLCCITSSRIHTLGTAGALRRMFAERWGGQLTRGDSPAVHSSFSEENEYISDKCPRQEGVQENKHAVYRARAKEISRLRSMDIAEISPIRKPTPCLAEGVHQV